MTTILQSIIYCQITPLNLLLLLLLFLSYTSITLALREYQRWFLCKKGYMQKTKRKKAREGLKKSIILRIIPQSIEKAAA
jgi:hypothetical protein